jgi:hypothetical protein
MTGHRVAHIVPIMDGRRDDRARAAVEAPNDITHESIAPLQDMGFISS